MDYMRSLLLHLPEVKAILTLPLGPPCPKVSWCFAKSHSFGVGFCIRPSSPITLHVGHGKPDGVFAEAAARIPQRL